MVSLNLSIDTFILVVRELKLHNEIRSINLVNEILKSLEDNKSSISANTVQGLTKVIDSLVRINNLDIKSTATKLSFLLKFNPDVYKNLINVMNEDVSDNYSLLITNMKKDIEYNHKKLSFVNFIKTFYNKIKNSKSNDNLALLNEFKEKLKDYDFTKSKIPGIIDEVDLDNEKSFEQIAKKIETNNKSSSRMKSGWNGLNEMLGGGFRRGETVLLSALQHQFKSGTLRSLFCQLVQYNKPFPTQSNKKPLALFISFEDDVEIIFDFIYKYLKYSLEGEVVKEDKNNKNDENKSLKYFGYIKSKLEITGFKTLILRVRADLWSYQTLVDKILDLEDKGYEVQILVTDYLSKLPLTGINNTGPMGTGVRDLLTRVRDFCCEKNILYLNAHQLSTEAKQLLRNGIPAEELVQEIANKGYYEGCKQLDQVVDLEIYQHIAKISKDNCKLTIQRGKRRFPEHIDESKRYFTLQFPNDVMCIPPDIALENTSDNKKIDKEEDFDIF